MKMNLITDEKGKSFWKPNLSKLVESYDNIGHYELEKTEWKKPIEVIYGSLSQHINEKEIHNYLKPYPHMSIS